MGCGSSRGVFVVPSRPQRGRSATHTARARASAQFTLILPGVMKFCYGSLVGEFPIGCSRIGLRWRSALYVMWPVKQPGTYNLRLSVASSCT